MSEKPLAGRVILVTGASRGIGYAGAEALAAAGAQIIAIGRTQGALEELDDSITNMGGSCTLVPIDLRNFDGIDQLASIINDRWGRLDGLFGNAGVLGDLMPTHQVNPKDFDEVLSVNLVANYRLIRAMDPLLRQSESGRAVFVTSGVAANGRAYWGAYAASKGGLEGLVNSYASEIEITKMRVNLLNPGGTATQMRAKAVPGEDPTELPTPAALGPLIVDMLSPSYSNNGQTIKFRETDYYNG